MSRKSVTFFCYKGQKSPVFRAPCKKNKRKLFGLFNIIIHLCTLYRSPMSFGKNFHKGSQEGRKGYIFGGGQNGQKCNLFVPPGHARTYGVLKLWGIDIDLMTMQPGRGFRFGRLDKFFMRLKKPLHFLVISLLKFQFWGVGGQTSKFGRSRASSFIKVKNVTVF